MGMMEDFKEFAMRENVIDMAVGIIIGVEFGTVVKSLVLDDSSRPTSYGVFRRSSQTYCWRTRWGSPTAPAGWASSSCTPTA